VAKYVTEAEFGKTLEKIGQMTRRAIDEAVSTRLAWKGAWREGTDYAVNDLCQDRGALFVCKAKTTGGRPGANPGWQLLHKTKAEATK
jgi:hypothetical protein